MVRRSGTPCWRRPISSTRKQAAPVYGRPCYPPRLEDGVAAGAHSYERNVALIEASDAMIYVVGQGRAVHSKDLQKLLQRITTTSGGRAFFSTSPQKLDEAFGEILDDLHHQYSISYPAPDDQRDGKWHSITIKAGGGKYKVRARQGYRMVRKN